MSASFRRVQGPLSLYLLWKPHPQGPHGDGNYVTVSRGVESVTGLHLQKGRSPRSGVPGFLCSLGKSFLKLWAAVITMEVSLQVKAWP